MNTTIKPIDFISLTQKIRMLHLLCISKEGKINFLSKMHKKESL